MGLPGLLKLQKDSIVSEVEIVYGRPDWLCRALKRLLIEVWWDDLQKLDLVVSDADVDCYQYCNPDDRNVAIGVLLKGLGIAHCVVRGGIGATKSRESAPTVDLRRDALEIVIAQLPQDHPAVLALSYLVRPDVRDAAQAVREAGQAPQTLFKPVAYRKYPDYLRAQTLRELRDAIAAGRDVVVEQASTVDADKVFGFVAACFPHKRTAARTLDGDIHFFMDMIAYCRQTKKKSARLIYLARKYAAVPAVHMLLCAWLLCGGNDFMVGYIALASRTNKGNATERKTFFAMLDQMMAGARPVMSLDELFDFLCATREERIRVVFFIEDGRVRRGLEAAVELAPTAAARERIIDMFSMVAMSELYEIVEAVIAAACATPEGVRAIKATGRVLGDLAPTEKESAVVRADALIVRVNAVCASACAALRASALFGHGGAAVLEVLAVPPSAADMMKDLRDEVETHERRGDVGARVAERLLRRLEGVVVRLEDRFRRAALVVSRANAAFALIAAEPLRIARDRNRLLAAFSGNAEAIDAVDGAYACCTDGRRGLVQPFTRALTACLSEDEGTVKAALAAADEFDIGWLRATFHCATGAATDAIRAFRAAQTSAIDVSGAALFFDPIDPDGVAVGLAAITDAAFAKVGRSLVAALTAVAGGDCAGGSSHLFAADAALQDLQRLCDLLARAATGTASDSSSLRVLVQALVHAPSPDVAGFVCDWETESRPAVVGVPPPPPPLPGRPAAPWRLPYLDGSRGGRLHKATHDPQLSAAPTVVSEEAPQRAYDAGRRTHFRRVAPTHLSLHSGAAARDLDTGKLCRVVEKVWGGGVWKVWFPDEDELVERSADKLEAIEAPPNLPRRPARPMPRPAAPRTAAREDSDTEGPPRRPGRQECPRPAALRPRSPRPAAPLPNMKFMSYVPDESDIDFPAFDILEDFKTAKPLTFDEKQGLRDDINALPPDKLAHVVKTVQESIPLRGRHDDDEIVDIETLDNDTLRHLQNYVEASLTKNIIGLRKLRDVLVLKEGYATVDLAGWSAKQYGCGGAWYFSAPGQRRQFAGITGATKHYKATRDPPPGAAPVVAPPAAAITPTTLPPRALPVAAPLPTPVAAPETTAASEPAPATTTENEGDGDAAMTPKVSWRDLARKYQVIATGANLRKKRKKKDQKNFDEAAARQDENAGQLVLRIFRATSRENNCVNGLADFMFGGRGLAPKLLKDQREAILDALKDVPAADFLAFARAPEPSSASAPPCASAPFGMPPSSPPRPAPFNDSSNLNLNSPPA